MSAIPYVPPRSRTRRFGRRSRSAGPFTYLFLLLVVAGSIFPLYWSLVVASHDNAAVSAYPPVLTPGHELWHNVKRLFNSGEVNVSFWTALANSAIVAAVPNDLIDASRVDGCHTARVFWHVVLPAVRPAAAVLGLLTFMNTWNDFFWPLIVLSPRNPTVQVGVSTLASGYVEDYALVLTGTFVSILPLLAVFLVLGKQIIGGIMQGAVKG